MTALPLRDFTAAEKARLDAIEAAPAAEESDDPQLWEVLSDLIPCNDYAGCSDECECAEGELRLAVLRLIVAERVHHADCGEDEDCCNATVARARLVNEAAVLRGPSSDAEQAVLDLAAEWEGNASVRDFGLSYLVAADRLRSVVGEAGRG